MFRQMISLLYPSLSQTFLFSSAKGFAVLAEEMLEAAHI